MKRVGFLTSEEDPHLIEDDRLAIAPVKVLGIEAVPVVWDQEPDLTSFDAFVFRSCWNYHHKQAAFEAFLNRLEATGTPVFNSLKTARWNLHKGYLFDLEGKGAKLPRTMEFLANETDRQHELDDFLFQFRPDQGIVIKPAVSMSGHDTFLFKAGDRARILQTVAHTLKGRDVLVQEFIPDVKYSGEVSMIFFGGEFSHGVRKIPAMGEFRSQHEYGGSREPFMPSVKTLNHAKNLVDAVGSRELYLRVDGIEHGGEFYLIELEAIDPMLYFHIDSRAATRFAVALASKI